ncbi:anti-sigma factor domain-containing protein [Streptomyces sp. NPDC058284]|uniref:anti-sigma factor n=1 Tax=unclassified Streptomyces TaxID=2593676 RepID=UPI0036671F5B
MTNMDDPHTFTGAYALHALGDEERAAAEEHLARCEACAQEVREFTETAARLGQATAVAPRRGMRDDVLRRITTIRQEVPRTGPDTGPDAGPDAERGPGPGNVRQRAHRLSRWALAACLAAAASLGGTAVWQHQQAQDAREQARQTQRQAEDIAAVLAAPDARTRTGKLSGGGSGTVVVSASRDRAAFLVAGLPAPPRGKVYQLWFDDGGGMRPAGLLDPGADTESLLLDGRVDRARGMGITVEPAGGSPRPTSAPVALMDFPA